jgi:asparagine synthase (glutamine-hydrolysing)
VALRRELEGLGASFRTRSDTEVLVEAYRAWGADCLARLHGMFGFAIWDAAERTLFCARDRAGEKPFYYAEVGDAFIFGSELKALVKWPGFSRRVSFPAVADFLTFGFIPDPKTIYEACYKLPPGHALTARCVPGERPVVGPPVRYWDFVPAPDPHTVDFGPELRETLQSVCVEMSFADVNVGTFLSGGVDSSSVTAALSRGGVPLTAYTIGFSEDAYDERRWAAQVVERYATRWKQRTVGYQDVAPVLCDLVYHFDEPFGDYSYVPTYYVCREARREVTVTLSGDGADETFAGYRKYQRLRQMARMFKLPGSEAMRSVARTALPMIPNASGARRTVEQYSAEQDVALADMLTLGLRRDVLHGAAAGPLAGALRDYRPVDVVRGHLAAMAGDSQDLVDRMRYLDMKLTLASGILVKVDRASMAVALEVRPVYLHPSLLALSTRIPSARLVEGGVAKAALKSALEPWLPKPLLTRRKMGFHMPFGQWVSDELEGLANEAARSKRLEGWFENGFFARLLHEHRSGRADHKQNLHNLLFLDRWLERWDPVW